MIIQETSFGPKTYLVWRKEIAIADISDHDMWNTAFTKVYHYTQDKELKVVGPGTALYLMWDEAGGRTEIGIGFPIEQAIVVTDTQLSVVEVPTSKAVHGMLKGSYDGLKDLHGAIMEYAKSHDLKTTLAIEEYTTDPSKVPDSNDWETNVYYVCE